MGGFAEQLGSSVNGVIGLRHDDVALPDTAAANFVWLDVARSAAAEAEVRRNSPRHPALSRSHQIRTRWCPALLFLSTRG